MVAVLISTAHGAMLKKQLAARSLAAAGLPDPHCKTGIVSLKLQNVTGKPRSCCAGYCGACNDYETCKSVRGQDSENACCASKVFEMRCGNAPANVCLKKCSESVPPCIMDVDIDTIDAPKVKTVKGVPPCGEVIPHARAMHANAVEKGEALTDVHKAGTWVDEAVSFAKAAQAKAKTDLANPDFPDDYKTKLEAQVKQAQMVIDFAEKHRSKMKGVADAIAAVVAGQELPKDVSLKLQEISLEAKRTDKDGLSSLDEVNSLHAQAYLAVFEIAKKEADEAAAEAARKKEAADKKAAEEKAAKEAAAAAKAAAEKKAADEKAAKEKAAKEKAAKEAAAAAKAAADKKAAAEKAAKEAAAAAKAAEEAKAAADEAARKKAEAKKATTALTPGPVPTSRSRTYLPYCTNDAGGCQTPCVGGWMYMGWGDIAGWDLRGLPQPSGTPATVGQLEYARSCMKICESSEKCHGFTIRGNCNFKTGKAEGQCCDPKSYDLYYPNPEDPNDAAVYWKCSTEA